MMVPAAELTRYLSLRDVATVSQTPPLGAAEVLLCWIPLLPLYVFPVLPVHVGAGGSQVLGSHDSACSPSLISQRLHLYSAKGGQ